MYIQGDGRTSQGCAQDRQTGTQMIVKGRDRSRMEITALPCAEGR